MDALLLTYGMHYTFPMRPAGDPSVSDGSRGAPMSHPVNPYSLARLMTGKIATNRTELVAAFGMPLEKILEVNGPLHNPDLAAIAARRQPPVDNTQRSKATKASGAVDDAKSSPSAKSKSSGVKISKPQTFEQKASVPIDVTLQSLADGGVTCAAWSRMSDVARFNTLMNFGLATSMNANVIAAQVTASCSTTTFATPTTLAVRPNEATKIRDWTTQVQDPSGPGHYTEGEEVAELRRAVEALARAGITCSDWNAMPLSARENAADAIVRGATPNRSDAPGRVAREISPYAEQLAERITLRCSAVRPSASGIRDANTLLRMMAMDTNGWFDLTCQQQFSMLGRINGDLVPPAFTLEQMRREVYEQWLAIQRFAPTRRDRFSARGWYEWAYVGGYSSRAPSVLDPCQGVVGNCYLIASLAGTAWVLPGIIASRSWRGNSSPADGSSRATGITFADPRSGSLVDHTVTMSARLPVCITESDFCDGGRPFCHAEDNDQSWPGLWEKAMRTWVTNRSDPPMASDPAFPNTFYFLSEDANPAMVVAGGDGQTHYEWQGERVPAVSGFQATLRNLSGTNPSPGEVWTYLDEHCDPSGKVRSVIIAGSLPSFWNPVAGIVPSHFYTLLGIDRSRRMVYLRNPWGHISPGAAHDQRGSWMGLSLGLDNGVGVVGFQSFYDNFILLTGNWYATRRIGDGPILRKWEYDDAER